MKYYFTANHARVSSRVTYTLAAILVAGVLTAMPLSAINYDAKIKDLKQEVGGLDQKVEHLRVKGNTLKEAIGSLNARINDLESKIAKNGAQRDKLSGEIEVAKINIEKRKQALKDNLRRMYLDEDISNVEMVASSKSISQFIDKQEYRNSIQGEVSSAMDELREMKKQLEADKKKIEQLIYNQRAMAVEVDNQKSMKAELLQETRGKAKNFKKVINQKEEKIEELKKQQAAAIAAAAARANSRTVSWAGSGSYPWAGVSFPSTYSCSGVDPWGMCYRQCVSYTAWKVASTGRFVPYGLGNANMWPGQAQAAGIQTGYTPKAGAVAILMAGPYGHSMYVEQVLNGGSEILLSEYNYNLDGTYTKRIQSSAGLTYIYF